MLLIKRKELLGEFIFPTHGVFQSVCINIFILHKQLTSVSHIFKPMSVHKQQLKELDPRTWYLYLISQSLHFFFVPSNVDVEKVGWNRQRKAKINTISYFFLTKIAMGI